MSASITSVVVYSSILLASSLFASSGSAFAQTGGDSGREAEIKDLQLKAIHESDQGHYDEACSLYLRELDLLVATGKQAQAGNVYTALGEIHHVHGRFPSAETSYKQAIDLLSHHAPPDDPRLVNALDDLGWLYVTWGRFTEGSRLMDRARDMADRHEPKDARFIQHLDTQAAFFAVAGRYSEAQKTWNRALDIGARTYGPDAPEFDSILVHFGQASALVGDLAGAAKLFRRYLDIENKTPTGECTARAVAAGELAHVYAQLHKFDEAQHWFDDALRVFKANPGDAPLIHSMVLSYLGDYHMLRREWAEAQSQYRAALDMQLQVLGENHATAATMVSVANALKKLHHKDEAKEMETRAKTILAAEKAPQSGQTVDVMALRRQ